MFFVLIVSVFIHFIRHRRNRKSKYIYRALRKLVRVYVIKLFEYLTDQGNYIFKFHSSKVLWIFSGMSLYVVIHGFATNLISADLIAVMPPPLINSVKDLVSRRFNSTAIVIVKESLEYDAIRSAPDGNILHELYVKLESGKGGDASISNMDDLMHKFETLVSGESVLIANTENWELISKPFYCCHWPNKMKYLHLSAEFCLGTFNSIFSSSIDRNLRNYIELRQLRVIEAGFLSIAVKQHAIDLYNNAGFAYSWEVMQCDRNYRDNGDSRPISSIPIKAMRSTLLFYSYCLALANVILIAEMLRKICFFNRRLS